MSLSQGVSKFSCMELAPALDLFAPACGTPRPADAGPFGAAGVGDVVGDDADVGVPAVGGALGSALDGDAVVGAVAGRVCGRDVCGSGSCAVRECGHGDGERDSFAARGSVGGVCLGGVAVGDMSVGQLRAVLGELGRRDSAAAALKACLLAALGKLSSAVDAQQVAVDELGASRREAKRDVETASQLEELPGTTGALGAGEIPSLRVNVGSGVGVIPGADDLVVGLHRHSGQLRCGTAEPRYDIAVAGGGVGLPERVVERAGGAVTRQRPTGAAETGGDDPAAGVDGYVVDLIDAAGSQIRDDRTRRRAESAVGITGGRQAPQREVLTPQKPCRPHQRLGRAHRCLLES